MKKKWRKLMEKAAALLPHNVWYVLEDPREHDGRSGDYHRLPRLRARLTFAWYDLYVGIYIDRKDFALYFFPVPMLGVKLWVG